MATDDQLKALLFQHPDKIPISCGILPAAWMKYRDELEAITDSYPEIFGSESAERDYDQVQGNYAEGTHVDAWGCEWENIHHGMAAIVTGHPVPDRQMVNTLKVPTKDEGCPHGFMYLRLQDLRGFEEIMMDFAEEPPELQMLIDLVLEYNLRQVRLMIEQNPEKGAITYFGDDLGMQNSLPMNPEMWRKYLKPCFYEIYSMVKKAGKYVYMHTDGHIHEIIMDLKECGADVVNPQVRANGLDNLRRVCKGEICVDLDLDRQLFPFCTPGDIDAHVHEAVEKLGAPEGGLWLRAEIDQGVPLENVDAVCRALVKYSTYY